MAQLHVIYVPGLGDTKTYGQDIAIKLWRLLGVHGHYHAVMWHEGSFAPKLSGLVAEIDAHVAAGHRVGLVGFSAGATAVLNAFAERRTQLCGVVCISGKIQNPTSVGSRFRNGNPAFIESLDLVQRSLASLTNEDKTRIVTIYPRFDQMVTVADASIEGVTMWRSPAMSHMTSVAYSLLVGSFRIVRFFRAHI